MAEEETIDDTPLTYDRPELCNKVTLRRSSIGMWKVCSSGQNHENENVKLGFHVEKRENEYKKKSSNNVDSGNSENRDVCGNTRVLRSGKTQQVDTTTTLGDMKFKGGHKSDSENITGASAKCHNDNRSSLNPTIDQFSRSLMNSKISSDSGSGDDCLVESKSMGSFGEAMVPWSNCRSTSSDDSNLDLSLPSFTRNTSSNHKYATRQKFSNHDKML